MGRTKQILEEQFVDGKWEELMSNLNTDISPSIYKAMEVYATECCEATLKEASKNAKISSHKWSDRIREEHEIKKESITNPNNIILL